MYLVPCRVGIFPPKSWRCFLYDLPLAPCQSVVHGLGPREKFTASLAHAVVKTVVQRVLEASHDTQFTSG